MRRCWLVALIAGVAVTLWAISPVAASASTRLLVISGIGGEREFSELFFSWSKTLYDAATQRQGIPGEHITVLTENPARGPDWIDGRSTREDIAAAFATVAAAAAPDDTIVIVLFGHGTSRSDQTAFNIPGPDLTDDDFAAMLSTLGSRRVAFVNTSSASGPFLTALAGPNRAVITATSSGAERYFAVFGGYFASAFAEPGADINKDGRVSLLEAYLFSRREVQREFSNDNRLLTEHALLDDNADGEATELPLENAMTIIMDNIAADGQLAAQLHLTGPVVSRVSNSTQAPALTALLSATDDLTARVDALRQRKSALALEDYEDQLEELLVNLALKHREIKQLRVGP